MIQLALICIGVFWVFRLMHTGEPAWAAEYVREALLWAGLIDPPPAKTVCLWPLVC